MGFWDTIRGTVVSEFSDVDDLQYLTRVVLRLVLAAILGGLLGLERERQHKDAGIRTHMLVCAGSSLVVLVPVLSGFDEESVSRVLQGLLAGIGLLCAGTILKVQQEDRIRGLTTAAGLWMTSAIGMSAGLGREMTAVIATALVLLILLLERPLARWGLKETDRAAPPPPP